MKIRVMTSVRIVPSLVLFSIAGSGSAMISVTRHSARSGQGRLGVDKLIISVATTGSRTMRSQTPYVPITEEEIAQQALDCWRAGAAIAHIHVRDEHEHVSCSPGALPEGDGSGSRGGLRHRHELVDRRGAGRHRRRSARASSIRLAPELASFDCGSTNFGSRRLHQLAEFPRTSREREMNEHLVTPEIEIFDTGMIQIARELIDAGSAQPAPLVPVRAGRPWRCAGNARELTHMVRLVSGRRPLVGLRHRAAPAADEHDRDGDGRARRAPGSKTTSTTDTGNWRRATSQLVERPGGSREQMGRELATPNEARELIGVNCPAWPGG